MEAVEEKSGLTEIKEKAMGSNNHSLIQGNIIGLFFIHYLHSFRILPELNLLIEDKKYIPDISIYKDRKFQQGRDQVLVDTIPLGAIEILSPTQVLGDLIAKSHTYFEAGIASYWIVLPDLRSIYVYKSVTEYEIFAKNDTLKDEILNIQFNLEDIFR